MAWLSGLLVIDATGLTVITTVIGLPEQVTPLLVNDGVTVYVAVSGFTPLFTSVCTIELPVPFDAPVIPPVTLTVQLKTAPVVNELRLMFVDVLVQIASDDGVATTSGTGLTVMLYTFVGPAQAAASFVVALAV